MNTFERILAPALILIGSLAAPASAQSPPVKPDVPEGYAVATFAGGCFWCMEPPYDELDGVVSTISGYIGGHKENPTYYEVSDGVTGHTEAVQVVYDPRKIDYERLLEVFWHNIDPLTLDAQFCDVGTQYRTGIFYHDEAQKRAAEKSKKALEESDRFDRPIVTEITAAKTFYPAEDYHQDYYMKNPIRYKFYRYSCGRDERLEELWGKKS
ncbi:MAG: peptide-methionine (S)-S-oxide reductase MsrA [Gammaproteobacteria bacterium]|nr:peptide-methionine (S)-S-oxide reductase MsrA [Gammaproteobacteria bacterium]